MIHRDRLRRQCGIKTNSLLWLVWKTARSKKKYVILGDVHVLCHRQMIACSVICENIIGLNMFLDRVHLMVNEIIMQLKCPEIMYFGKLRFLHFPSGSPLRRFRHQLNSFAQWPCRVSTGWWWVWVGTSRLFWKHVFQVVNDKVFLWSSAKCLLPAIDEASSTLTTQNCIKLL